jgi:hypothetical protein
MKGALMDRYPDVKLTEEERATLRELIIHSIIQANLNGVAIVFQRLEGPLPIMPSTVGTTLHSGNRMITSAIRSHIQFQLAPGPNKTPDQLIPSMAVVTNLVPQSLKVVTGDGEVIPISYDICLLHLFTELTHELSHAITYPSVETAHSNTICKNPFDSEKKCAECELQTYQTSLNEQLFKKVIQFRLHCHIFRDGTEAVHNNTINELLRLHFEQGDDNDGVQNTEQKDG